MTSIIFIFYDSHFKIQLIPIFNSTFTSSMDTRKKMHLDIFNIYIFKLLTELVQFINPKLFISAIVIVF